MSQKMSDQIKVGTFVLLGLMVTATIIFALGKEKRLFESQYELKAQFTDISGLRTGAPVFLAGIKIGRVSDINFSDQDEDKHVHVILKIADKYKKRIREDSIAEIVTQGLLGDKAVFITVGTSQYAVLKDQSLIKSKKVSGLAKYMDQAGELMDNFNMVAINLNKMLEGPEGEKGIKSFNGILKSIDKILTEIRSGNGLINALIYDPQGRRIVTNLNSMTGSAARLLGNTHSGTLGPSLSKTMNNLSYASYDLREILDKIEKGEGSLGAMVNDPTVFNELKLLLGKANRNKLVKAVVRGTLNTKDKNLHE